MHTLLYVTFRKMPKLCWSDFILVRISLVFHCISPHRESERGEAARASAFERILHISYIILLGGAPRTTDFVKFRYNDYGTVVLKESFRMNLLFTVS